MTDMQTLDIQSLGIQSLLETICQMGKNIHHATEVIDLQRKLSEWINTFSRLMTTENYKDSY